MIKHISPFERRENENSLFLERKKRDKSDLFPNRKEDEDDLSQAKEEVVEAFQYDTE